MFSEMSRTFRFLEFQIPKLAVGMIKGNATCGPIHTTDNIGTVIQSGDIKRFYTSLEEDTIIAEGMLRRARQAVDASGKESVIDIRDLEVNVLRIAEQTSRREDR